MLKGMTDTNLDRDHMASILEVAAGGNAEPYDPASKPSPHTTPLARFSSKRPLVPTDAEPELRAFAEARCEIDQIDIAFPFQLAKTESAVAALCATGGKPRERSTVVRIYSLDLPEPERGYPRYISVPVRMSSGSLGEHILLDDTRKTLYVGNGSQIQSFVYAFDGIDQKDTGEFKSGHGTAPMRNIFNAAGYGGAMTTIRDGSRLLRSGKKGLAVWNMEPGKLPLPGSKDVAAPRQMITSPAMTGISVWTEHPSEPLQRIAAYDHRYGATLVTFQTQQIVTRYVGHGGFIRDIQTSADDANTFITAAEDGAVRMYDVRLPTPVLAIYHRDEPIRAALYQHIHQQPFVILGGTKSEQVKVWDVRAKLPLYELSTGNNQVNALAWDEPRQTLYAATECCYKDRNGYRIGYRAAQFPDSGEDDRRTWPEQAYHSETSFGYPLDSCDQRLYRYTFKEDADVTVLPSYGPS
ncbi:hypothetical protein BV25DRAFT_1432852 [Artomyces pyxidatus]|uniref:Uncharacterized protein n=1 Tax=Artomyces pyxidatus TaxID=48021 RepID=A0ACB8SNK0_9AGAM|nr:hypothetical protein BV25DRAFT_1432852 [Artomyces pyxidatus]